MAGGSHSKSSSHRPPPPSAASTSASVRKSRWESSSSTAVAGKDPLSDLKPPPKVSNPNSNPSPKPAAGRPSPRPTPPITAEAIRPPSLHAPPFPFPDLGPPPPPTYGFHMLDRRTIVLADGSVRSYFALHPDYQDFPARPPPRFHPDFPCGGPPFPPMSPEGLVLPGPRDKSQIQIQSFSMKRKFGGEDELRYNPNGVHPMGPGPSSPFRRDSELRAGKYIKISGDDDNSNIIHNNQNNVGVVVNNKRVEAESEVKKAFLQFVKLINENETERKRYLEGGKQGRLKCLACDRSSKDFSDMHALISHAYNSDNADLRVDHLGLHKALCVLMGWNFSKPPDNSKTYQFLTADEAAANQDDLIMWPPMVIIHNTITGKGKDGRMEGLGNKAMDNKMRDLGFAGGKSKSLYGRDGHLGITLIKFNGDQSGLTDALRLADHFEKENHGRKAWGHLQPVTFGKDDEKNPNLVKVDRSGEKKRILYGYLGTVADLCKVDFETRKKVKIESQRDYKALK